MRLINTSTLRLEEFFGSYIPPFATLSHTWEDGEVSFAEFQDPESAAGKKGYGKIRSTCKLAKAFSLEYAWVDTYCINKDSSAELTEALNSMFNWYRGSKMCYTFLSDLPLEAYHDENKTKPAPDIPYCRWFTRGWTLQELIASEKMYFFNQRWKCIGDKRRLSAPLAKVTRIPEEVLSNRESISNYTVAARMAWASSRRTTRVEDEAYCLLGLFGVNMPLLYGEGTNAFLRLQEEIIKQTNDLSIFAWTAPPCNDPILNEIFHGLFAPAPSHFLGSSKVTQDHSHLGNEEFSSTNKGLKFSASLIRPGPLLFLGCLDSERRNLYVQIKHYGPHLYCRENAYELVRREERRQLLTIPGSSHHADLIQEPFIYVSKTLSRADLYSILFRPRLDVQVYPMVRNWFRCGNACPSAIWDPFDQSFLLNHKEHVIGYLELIPINGQTVIQTAEQKRQLALTIGWSVKPSDYEPGASLACGLRKGGLEQTLSDHNPDTPLFGFQQSITIDGTMWGTPESSLTVTVTAKSIKISYFLKIECSAMPPPIAVRK